MINGVYGLGLGLVHGNKTLLVPSEYEIEAENLFSRMTTADGVAPDGFRKAAINTCIKSLKAESLWDTQFNNLVVLRGTGEASTKLNWIKNATNATGVNSPLYTNNVGYKTNGNSSYLNTNYNPTSHGGTLYTLTNSCFLLKVSGLGAQDWLTHSNGSWQFSIDTYRTNIGSGASGYAINCKSIYGPGWNLAGSPYSGVNGYHAVTKNTANTGIYYRNADTASIGIVGTYLPAQAFHILKINNSTGGGTQEYCLSTTVMEFYAMGAYLTQAKFNTLQTIMNTYFAAL